MWNYSMATKKLADVACHRVQGPWPLMDMAVIGSSPDLHCHLDAVLCTPLVLHCCPAKLHNAARTWLHTVS